MFHRDSFEPSALIVTQRAGPSTLVAPGSVVRLRSGGPIGLVQNVDADDLATVVWFSNPRCTRLISDVCLSLVSTVSDPRRSEQPEPLA